MSRLIIIDSAMLMMLPANGKGGYDDQNANLEQRPIDEPQLSPDGK